jgi:hypothetical protein
MTLQYGGPGRVIKNCRRAAGNGLEEKLERIEMHIAEISAIVDVLLFVNEEAEMPQMERLRSVQVSLLYIASDRLGEAGRELAGLLMRH